MIENNSKTMFKGKFSSKKQTINEKDLTWNRFIDTICSGDISAMSGTKRKAVMCFWYDAEVNSGGHSGYFDNYPDTDINELAAALTEISHNGYADNLTYAAEKGSADDYRTADMNFGSYDRTLTEYLRGYVEANRQEIFN